MISSRRDGVPIACAALENALVSRGEILNMLDLGQFLRKY